MPPKSISSFFKPTATKTKAKAKASKHDEEEDRPTKKRKEDDASSPQESDSQSSIDDEVKQKIEQKKLEAQTKLAITKGTPTKALLAKEWHRALGPEFDKQYYKDLLKFLEAEKKAKKTIFPPVNDVFSWSHACEFKDVKVVILGQDPYHGPNQAHGLCFSVKKGVKIPPSLLNMYKLLEKDVKGFKKPDHGYLQSWADQGVLLLNAVLTVQQARANSHKSKGWEKFTNAIIEQLNTSRKGIVFLLWGGYAQKKGKGIDKNKHLVLSTIHPSPLSVNQFGPKWFECAHFSQTNKYLAEQGKTEIDWKIEN